MLYISGLPEKVRDIFPLYYKEPRFGHEFLRYYFWRSLRQYFMNIELEDYVLFRGANHMMLYKCGISMNAVRYDLSSAYPTLLIYILEHGIPIKVSEIGYKCSMLETDDHVKVTCDRKLIEIIQRILSLRQLKDHYIVIVTTRNNMKLTRFHVALKPGYMESHRFNSELYQLAKDIVELDRYDVVQVCRKIPYTCYIMRLTDFAKYGLLVLIGYLARKLELSQIHYAIIDMCYDIIQDMVTQLHERGITIYYTYVDCVCYENVGYYPQTKLVPAKVEDVDDDADIYLPPLFRMEHKFGAWLIANEDVYMNESHVKIWNIAEAENELPPKNVIKRIMYEKSLIFLETRNLRVLERTRRALLDVFYRLSDYGYRVKIRNDRIHEVKNEREINWFGLREKEFKKLNKIG